jgi:hypothetical protein
MLKHQKDSGLGDVTGHHDTPAPAFSLERLREIRDAANALKAVARGG